MALVVSLALVSSYLGPDVIKMAVDRGYALRTLCDTQLGSLCDYVAFNPYIVYQIAALAVLAGLLMTLTLLVRWCIAPIRALIPSIEKVGPQNLGYRIRPGAGRTALVLLARAIDDMMDRIAAGYEGQRRFAANASHELRTPLAVQRTLIEVGMAQPLTQEQLQLLTVQLLHTNERNERLIEALLVLSESDRGLVSRTPQRLDRIVEEALAAHQASATAAQVTVTSRLVPRVVLGEQVMLERLVTNLLQNAIKYNRLGGTIDVVVGNAPSLVVTNTGSDVPMEAVAGLFEPFRRLSSDRIDHSGGAGLGLTIARSIANAHDGTISAVSTGRDGLRVEITFPPA